MCYGGTGHAGKQHNTPIKDQVYMKPKTRGPLLT